MILFESHASKSSIPCLLRAETSAFPWRTRAKRASVMSAKKMTVFAKAREAYPNLANRRNTRVAGSTKKNTRMQPVLSDAQGKKAAARKTS